MDKKTGRQLCATIHIDDAYEVFQSEERITEFEFKDTKIKVRVDESKEGENTGILHMQLRGLDIKNTEPGLFGLGRSDPFFEILRKSTDRTTGRVYGWNPVYRSEHIDDHLNPYWEKFSIDLEALCFCDLSWPIRIDVLDHEDDSHHHVIGHYETTVAELMDAISIRGNADREQALSLKRPGDIESGPSGKIAGLVVVLHAEIESA